MDDDDDNDKEKRNIICNNIPWKIIIMKCALCAFYFIVYFLFTLFDVLENSTSHKNLFHSISVQNSLTLENESL